MHALLHFGVLTLTVLLLARHLPGVHVERRSTALVVALVFSVVNFLAGWAIRAALFVPAILTLGLLFLFVPFIVNTIVLWITDKLVKTFELRDAKTLFLSAAVITAVNWVIHVVVGL